MIMILLERKSLQIEHKRLLRLQQESEQARSTEVNHIQAILQSSRKYIEAESDVEIIQETLQLALELTGAVGVSFVPLDDHSQPMGTMKKGEFPMPVPDAWLEYLASPAIRHDCSQCNQSVDMINTCALLKGPFSDAIGLYCFPLIISGLELGVLNLFLPNSEKVSQANLELLRSLLDTTALALMGVRLRRREIETKDQIRSVRRKKILEQIGSNANQLAEIEYEIIMEERTRLAREIHDGLAQSLGFLKLQIAQMKGFLEKNDLERLNRAIHTSYDALSTAYQDVRESIDALRVTPESEDENQLQAWIKQIVVEFEGSDAQNPVEVVIKDLDIHSLLPLEVHAQLIRIVQETFSNIRKHAQAEHVWISCREVAGELLVEIQDDGIGFSTEEVPEPSQHGLRGMRERTELIGGDIQITSRPNNGTTIRVCLPLESSHSVEVSK